MESAHIIILEPWSFDKVVAIYHVLRHPKASVHQAKDWMWQGERRYHEKFTSTADAIDSLYHRDFTKNQAAINYGIRTYIYSPSPRTLGLM